MTTSEQTRLRELHAAEQREAYERDRQLRATWAMLGLSIGLGGMVWLAAISYFVAWLAK